MKVFDGLNSMNWLRLGKLPGGFKIELADIPPRDRFKYSYDLWSQGLAADAYTIGRTYKLSMRNRTLGKGLWLMNFDSKGRVVNISFTGSEWDGESVGDSEKQNSFDTLPYPQNYRPEIHRLIGGSWLKGKWVDHIEDTNLTYRPEVIQENHPFFRAAMKALNSSILALKTCKVEDVPETSRPLLNKFLALDPLDWAGLEAYQRTFHQILHIDQEIPVEPPELSKVHYHAIPVMVEHGCGGTCTYCTLYDRKIRGEPVEEIFRQIDKMSALLGEEQDHYRYLVLLEGDILTVPTADLCAVMDYGAKVFTISHKEPFVHAFARAKSVCAKTDQELASLAAHGMRNINIGLETGCGELLHMVKPGQTLKEVHQAVARLHKAGIGVSLNILAGVGGSRYASQHVEETIRFVQNLPGTPDVYYSPLILSEHTPYYQQLKQFGQLSEQEKEQQCRIFHLELGGARYLFVPI